MSSSHRIVTISALAGAVAACFPSASIGAPSDRNAIAVRMQAELTAMRTHAVEKWRREHPTPAPQHPATTIPVTSCADDGSPGTFRAAIESVSTGDVVDLTNVPCDTITLTAGYLIPNLAAGDFTIQGPGMDALTISGGHTQQILQDVEYSVISIKDVTIADGYMDNFSGGCLCAFLPRAGFSLTRVTVTGCEAHQVDLAHGSDVFGGAIMTGGPLELVDSIVTGNTLSSELPNSGVYSNAMFGGGVYSRHGPVTVTRSSITSNRIVSTTPIQGSQSGGGLAVGSAYYTVTITDSVISNNLLDSSFVDDGQRTSWQRGAGLFAIQANTPVGDLVISNTTIDGNTMTSTTDLQVVYGGAISEAMNLTLSYSTLSSNQSSGYAGALWAVGPTAEIFNTTISGNHSVRDGGAAFLAGTVSVDNSTIAFNASDTGIGGIAISQATTLRSTISSNNEGATTPDIGLWTNGTLAGDHDFIGDPAGVSVPGDTLTGDPMLAPLANNGGPTLTHALLSGSPAIDVGANPNGLDFDQRGSGFRRVNGAAADIGAFESGSADDIFANGFDS